MNAYSIGHIRKFLNDWLNNRLYTALLPGFSVAIRQGDQLLYNRAFGNNGENQLTTAMLFNIGSQTKMFTATAIMQLAERQVLSLEDAASVYLPWLTHHKNAGFHRLTIRQLLAHESGIQRDGNDTDFWQLRRPFPAAAQLRNMVIQSKLITAPTRKVKYSNIGYALLGQVIEAASGMKYGSYIVKNICEPLGLSNTHADDNHVPASEVAAGYTRPLPERLTVPQLVPSGAFASVTGVYSTSADMAAFMQAHAPHRPGLLTEESKYFLHRHQRNHWIPPQHRSVAYAHGFYRHVFSGASVLGHGGTFIGHSSCSFLDPVRDICVSVCANAKDAPQIEMQQGIWSVIDFFARYSNEPAPPHFAALERIGKNLFSTIAIVATSKKIVAANIDTWLPLQNADELTYVAAETCHIKKAHDFRSPGEVVKIPHDQSKPMRYAGATMLTPEHFDQWTNSLPPRTQA